MHKTISIGFLLTFIFIGCGSNSSDSIPSDTSEQSSSTAMTSQSSSTPETINSSTPPTPTSNDSQSILPTPIDEGTDSTMSSK